jgi:hypothetical protein
VLQDAEENGSARAVVESEDGALQDPVALGDLLEWGVDTSDAVAGLAVVLRVFL